MTSAFEDGSELPAARGTESQARKPGDGFVQIHPSVDYEAFCPFSGSTLRATDWLMPGLWSLAKLECAETGRSWWTDLPYGVGLLAPCCVDVATGEVVRPAGERWYADVTRAAWQSQSDEPVRLRVERRRQARRAILVNCLNPCWGDALSLLLRVNELRAHADLDVVVLATSNLEWLIPDFVAEAWLVDDRLASTSVWNNDLARQVKTLVSAVEACYIPAIFQAAQPSADALAEFSRTRPFPLDEWQARLDTKPVVTFVWRADRCWSRDDEPGGLADSRLARSRYLRGASRVYHGRLASRALEDQARRVSMLADGLRAQLPSVDFAVMGLGGGPALPSWVTDLRRDTIDRHTEREWCARAAASHVIVGVHGSHMLLPSGHAGATVELLPRARLANIMQDLLIPVDDTRDAVYRCRILPVDTPASVVADTVLSMLLNYTWMDLACHRRHAGPLAMTDVRAMRHSLTARADVLQRRVPGSVRRLLGP